MRIGVFGGTFDPPHVGHLIVAREAAERLELDRLLLVVAGQPPHKPASAPAPAELRLEMVRAAVGDEPLLEAADLEIRRGGPSYTVDTLRELRRSEPAAQLFLLIGTDQWRALGSWRDPAEVGRLSTIVVIARTGEDPASLGNPMGLSYQALTVRRLDVSSTEVRARVRERRSIRYLVPDPVRAIIERTALYEDPGC